MNDPSQSESVFDFVRRTAKNLGTELAEQCVTAYLVLVDPDTPTSAKLVLGGAFAYLVLPIDVVPDFLPVIGWSDDAVAIAAALAQVAVSIKPKHRPRASDILRSWGLGRA